MHSGRQNPNIRKDRILTVKRRGRLYLNMLLIATAILLVGVIAYAVFCIGENYLATRTARAENALDFEIGYDDGEWMLSSNGAELERFAGEFFGHPQEQNLASVIFKQRIDQQLQSSGATDYSLTFDLPDIFCTTVGPSAFDYTELAGSFALIADYAPIISEGEAVKESLQYRKSDSEFENYIYGDRLSGGLAFGRNVDVGEYLVRFVVTEEFTFDKKPYNVERHSQEVSCTVRTAVPVAPERDALKIEYGTKTADIADRLPKEKGSWSLSQQQTENADLSPDGILHVREEGYILKFDYIPNNKNYQSLAGLDVNVEITPRQLSVAVGDAFSLVGEPIAEGLGYRVLSPLIGGDREEDLNIVLLTDGVDVSVAGEYVVKAEIRNPDYVARSMNEHSQFIDGGRYIVYATSCNVVAPDGVVFEVLLGTGFIDLNLRVELVSVVLLGEGFAGNPIGSHGYEFIFENNVGERVYPSETFTVTWQEGALDGAVYAVIGTSKGVARETLKGRYLTVSGDTQIIAFYGETASESADALKIACIVMGALCSALSVALVALTIVYVVQRRKKDDVVGC